MAGLLWRSVRNVYTHLGNNKLLLSKSALHDGRLYLHMQHHDSKVRHPVCTLNSSYSVTVCKHEGNLLIWLVMTGLGGFRRRTFI